MNWYNTGLLQWMAVRDVYNGLCLRTNQKKGSSKLIPYSLLAF
ncbi:hypothetical protein [Nostoc sp. 'Peltigera membranacea cyanobiont' 210A]|nr:hypothetical protein [Nostoc sp. 'Peltigera membranacea cyanobiont' 210A]